MYRTHSQRVLDTILAMNLDQVSEILNDTSQGHLKVILQRKSTRSQVRLHLQHFWFGIPQHIASGLGCPVLVNVVALCDLALYKTVQGLLLPSFIQPMPERCAGLLAKCSFPHLSALFSIVFFFTAASSEWWTASPKTTKAG